MNKYNITEQAINDRARLQILLVLLVCLAVVSAGMLYASLTCELENPCLECVKLGYNCYESQADVGFYAPRDWYNRTLNIS